MKLSAISVALGLELPDGQQDREIKQINSPERAGCDDITFLSNPSYRLKVAQCAAPVVISPKNAPVEGKINLPVDDPYVAYARVAQLFEDTSPLFGEGVASSAIIDPSSQIGSGSSVGPGTVIGRDVVIGVGCRISANCIIEKDTVIGDYVRIDSGVIIRWGTHVGNRVIIQSGAVIGSDGFGNARENGVFIRIPCFGIVVIEDDVEIGACTTIDRGNFEPTVIGKGTRLDNLIHIAHNVLIGENTAIAAQSGISGSTKIGKRVIVGGQAGFVGHIEIGDDTFVGAKAGVSKGTEPGSKITGYPARDIMAMRRIEAAEAELPSLRKEFKKLQREFESVKNKNTSD